MNRAEACSDAIHKALFPRTDSIHRMANSRRQIEEIVREHFPEGAGARRLIGKLRHPMMMYPQGWRALLWHTMDVLRKRVPVALEISLYSNADSIVVQGIMACESTCADLHPTSDPTHVAD